MSSYEVRKDVDLALERNDRHLLVKLLEDRDSKDISTVLWDLAHEAKSSHGELNVLREKIKTLENKSGHRVRCIKTLPDRRALVKVGPVVEEVLVSPSINIQNLQAGTEVLIIGCPEGRMIAGIREPCLTEGRVGKVSRVLTENRAIIEDGGHDIIMKVVDGIECKEGDEVRYDLDAQLILEVITLANVELNCALDFCPTQTLDDVKGLEEEKTYIKERIIYPSIYKEKFLKYGIKPVKGALFHGSPGNGKSYLAGAIFNEMAKLKNKENATKGFFLVNGPEFLNRWAGSTEDSIRDLFGKARAVAKETGMPSLIFWDEIESITRRRKDSPTYSPETTVIPTLLTELQGLEQDNDVILIGATNRGDLIDPALMRPGRLGDAILEIPRPNKEGGRDILKANLTKNAVPEDLQKLMDDGLVNKIISHIYDNPSPVAFTTLKSGEKIGILRQELINGALLASLGQELIRDFCMAEIYNTKQIDMKDIIKRTDNMFLSQLGVLDAGVKNGFTQDISNYVIDVSME